MLNLLVDFIIVAVFVIYILIGNYRGFWQLMMEFLGLVSSFIMALIFYPDLAKLLISGFNLNEIYAWPISFLSLWFGVQFLYWGIWKIISKLMPLYIKESRLNYLLCIVPSVLKGFVFVTILLISFVVMPINFNYKNIVANSFLGGGILKATAKVENRLEPVFSGSNTSQNNSQSLTLIPKAEQMTLRPDLAEQMLVWLNVERAKNGIKPLALDSSISKVAEFYSYQMFKEGFFDHTSPEGITLKDRLLESDINFISAGENLALAPDLNSAESGLMNSPEHRQNILNPDFGRIGIGIVDGGEEGIIFTQDFTN